MSKRTIKKSTKPLSSKPATKQPDAAYPVEPEELAEQQHRVRSAAAAGVEALKKPTLAASPEAQIAPTAPAKPLAPLAAVWPSVPPLQPEAKPSQVPTTTAPAPTPTAPAKAPTRPGPIVAPAQKPTVSKEVKVTFALSKAGAKRVSLCGEFNTWSPTATPMKRHDDEHWETTLILSPGQYQYKFLVDGEWIPDPAAQKSVPNQYGSLNSVLEVRA